VYARRHLARQRPISRPRPPRPSDPLNGGDIGMNESPVTIQTIRNVLVNAISVELGVAPGDLTTDRPFAEYGVDSLAALSVAMEIEATFGLVDPPSTLLWDYPTVDTLAPALWDLLFPEPALTAPEAQ